MLILPAVRERLAGAAIAGVTRVHGSLQLNAALARGQFEADAYVVLRPRTAERNTLINATRQRVRARLSVVTVVRVANDAVGERQADELEARSAAIVARLLGWTPNPLTVSPLVYVSGRPLETPADGASAWADEFETDYQIEAR